MQAPSPPPALTQNHLDITGRGGYIARMSKNEILEELPKLTTLERQEIRLRLAELEAEDWQDPDDLLTAEDKAILDARLAAYEENPGAGSSWKQVKNRIRARLPHGPANETFSK
jgi:hypothetical protein